MADVKTWPLDADSAIPKIGMLPAGANTITEGGRIAWSNGSGYAIPSSAATAASKAWGIYLTHVDNSTGTTVIGNSGLNNGVPTGVPYVAGFSLLLGDGSVTAANVGAYVYLVSDSGTGKPTVGISDAGGTRPLVGYVAPYVRSSSDVDPSAIPVAIGLARPDTADPELGSGGSAQFKARGVVTANIASLAAFTVASNDGLTYTANQVVLLVGQTTKTQNGPYVVGTVTTGTAPLTRPDWYATGAALQVWAEFRVSEGTQGANSRWITRTVAPVTIDTTAVDIDMIDGNWVQMVDVTSAATQANPASVFVAAVQLKARLSGIFRVDVDISYNSGTTADVITAALLSDTSAAGVIAGANKAAHGVVGLGTFGTAGADAETMDGAGNLTYNGAAWSTAPITQRTETAASLTGLLTAQASGQLKFSFHGIVHNANGTTKTPFTIGSTVAFGVKFSATNTLTFANISMTAFELPSQ